MARSILSECDLGEEKLLPLVFIQQNSSVDGSFLLSTLIGKRLKYPNAGIILVCLHHSFEHYCNAGMKLGYNLDLSLKKGTIVTVEPLKEIFNEHASTDYLNGTIDVILAKLQNDIQHSIDELSLKKKIITIIIDDLSWLMDLGATEKDIVKFIINLDKLTKNNEKPITLLVKLNSSDIYTYLTDNLFSLANILIQLTPLKSGKFREVDGNMKIIKTQYNNEIIIDMQPKEKHFLYKVNDRNVKLFIPGELGIIM